MVVRAAFGQLPILFCISPDVIIQMNISEIRRYVKNLRGENRTLKHEIREYKTEIKEMKDYIKTLETQAVENLKEQGVVK